MKSSYILTLLSFLILTNHVHVQAQVPTKPAYLSQYCDPAFDNYTANSPYETNLKTVLSDLADHGIVSPFYSTSSGPVHAQYYCRGDITPTLCGACISEAANGIFTNCSHFQVAVMLYEECTVRYHNESMVGISSQNQYFSSYSLINVSDPNFPVVVNKTMGRLINQSAYGDDFLRFATGEQAVSAVVTIYALAQCSPDLNGTQCEGCLSGLFRQRKKCCGQLSQFLLMFYSSCQLRYSTDGAFYRTQMVPAPPPPFISTPPPSLATVTGCSTVIKYSVSLELGYIVAMLGIFMFMVETWF